MADTSQELNRLIYRIRRVHRDYGDGPGQLILDLNQVVNRHEDVISDLEYQPILSSLPVDRNSSTNDLASSRLSDTSRTAAPSPFTADERQLTQNPFKNIQISERPRVPDSLPGFSQTQPSHQEDLNNVDRSQYRADREAGHKRSVDKVNQVLPESPQSPHAKAPFQYTPTSPTISLSPKLETKSREEAPRKHSDAIIEPLLDLRNRFGVETPPQDGWNPKNGLPNGSFIFRNPHAFRMMVGVSGRFIRNANNLFVHVMIRCQTTTSQPFIVAAWVEFRQDSLRDTTKAREERKLVLQGLREYGEKDQIYLPEIDEHFRHYMERARREEQPLGEDAQQAASPTALAPRGPRFSIPERKRLFCSVSGQSWRRFECRCCTTARTSEGYRSREKSRDRDRDHKRKRSRSRNRDQSPKTHHISRAKDRQDMEERLSSEQEDRHDSSEGQSNSKRESHEEKTKKRKISSPYERRW
ncbi:hypothetical protein DL98DRAFT_596836 [Cadophora sp. DSE1049]|nr:hypothetical protein DL98DRAFT_596836 [Cadophora sp. DSE1049]